MAKRTLTVELVGDPKSLERSFSRGGKSAQRFGKDLSLVGRLNAKTGASFGLLTRGANVATGALIGGAGLTFALKSVTDANNEAEASNARLRAQLKASKISYGAHAKEIDRVIQRTSKLAALDDEDLQDAFTNIVRVTGNVQQSLKLTGLAADFARAKHMDVAKAGELVGKVAGGNTGVLSRYGLSVKAVTSESDKLAKQHGKVTVEQRRAAAEADKAATAQKAIGALQQKFGGQAAEYGRTSAAAGDRVQVAFENVREAIGAKLAPTVKSAENAVANFATELLNGTGAGGRFRDRVVGGFNDVKHAAVGLRAGIQAAFDPSEGIEAGDKFQRAGLLIGTAFRLIKTGSVSAVAAVRGWVRDNRAQIQQVVQAFRNVASVVRTVLGAAFGLALATVRRALPGIVTLVKGSLQVLGGVVRVFAALLTGDFRGAWNGVKSIVSGSVKVIIGSVRAMTAPLREAAARAAAGIGKGFRAAIGAVRSAVSAVGRGAVAVLHNLGARMIELGVNLIQGLINGIKSKAEDVKNAVTGIATGALDWAKKKLGIGSPSKEFHKVGVWVSRGLADGIESGKGMVEAAVKAGLLFPLDAAIQTLNDQKDKLQASFDTIDRRTQRSELVRGISDARVSDAAESIDAMTSSAGGSRKGSIKSRGGSVVSWLSGLARAAGLTVTSTTGGKHVAGSNHYKGLAIDAAGTPAKMAAFFDMMAKKFGPKLAELFYDPKGGIKNGKRIGAIGGHGDHVHAAVNSVLETVGKGMSGAGAKATGKLTANQVRGLAYAAGFRGHDLDVAVAIVMAESGGNTRASNTNKNGTTDRGLFQINSVHGAASTFDVNKNAAAAFSLYKKRGGFGDWTTFNTGAYKKFLGKTGSGKGSMMGLSGLVSGGDGGSITDAIKALRDFDREAARSDKLAKIDLQIKGLEAVKAFRSAIEDLGDSLDDLASQGASAFRAMREAQIDDPNNPLNAELAGLQARDAKEQNDRTERDLKKAVADAQFLVDHSGGKTHTDALQQLQDAQQDLDAFYRKQREDKIDADLKAQKDGLNGEEQAYRESLGRQFNDLMGNLESRKISYAEFVKQVNAIMAPLGGSFKGSPDQEAAINGVRNGVYTAAQANKFGVALAKGWGIEYRNGAATRFITPGEMKQMGFRARGGPVSAGRPYVVGEEGPEVFVPQSSGTVVPNDRLGGRGGSFGPVIENHGTINIGSHRSAEIMANKLARRVAFR